MSRFDVETDTSIEVFRLWRDFRVDPSIDVFSGVFGIGTGVQSKQKWLPGTGRESSFTPWGEGVAVGGGESCRVGSDDLFGPRRPVWFCRLYALKAVSYLLVNGEETGLVCC